MTSTEIAYFALLVSLLSLIVSFLTLHRDRHVLRAWAVPIQESDGLVYLQVTVSNSGKRPVSITHVLLRPAGHPGLFLDFAPKGHCKIDVGESRGCRIAPTGLPVTWSSVKEVRQIGIHVQDALGKLHRVRWQGKDPS